MRILATSNSIPLLAVRLALGCVIFPHGAQKMFGWFGGNGFDKTLAGFEHQGIPMVFGLLAILAEFCGSLGLIFGFLSRIAAFGIACNMAVAIALVHARNGFFMNWTGTKPGEGFEYHLLAIGIAVAIMIGGAGAASIDGALSRGRT
jgi:putative oxidoreductase